MLTRTGNCPIKLFAKVKVIHLFMLFQGNWTDEINQGICMAIKLSSRCMEIQLEPVNRESTGGSRLG